MSQPSITDIVGLCVFLATLFFSADVANVVGPYMAIVTAAAIGGSFALIRRDKSSRRSALFFYFRVCGVATIGTVVVSIVLAGYHPQLTERVLLAPVAFVIGLIGDDWPSLYRAGAQKLSALLDILIKLKGGGQ